MATNGAMKKQIKLLITMTRSSKAASGATIPFSDCFIRWMKLNINDKMKNQDASFLIKKAFL